MKGFMGSTMSETTMPEMGKNGGKSGQQKAAEQHAEQHNGADGQTFDAAKARFPVKHPMLVMLGLYLGAFLGMLSETSMNIALPVLSQDFNVSAGVAQWMVVGYMLVIGIVLPFTSLLSKWFKARNILFVGLAAFFIGSLVSAFAPTSSFAMLLIGRMIQGVSTGLVLPMMFAVILEVFPLRKIGFAMGMASLVIMFAPAIGPTLAGAFIGALSWRAIFIFFAVIAFVALICAAVWMVNPYELTRPKIDALSCITSILGFGGLVLGVGLISVLGFTWQVIAILVVGVLAIAWYSYRQLHMTNPVIDLHALGIRQFTVGALIVMMDFGITLASMYLMPQELQKGMGIAAAMTGLIMLPGGVINAVVSLISGKLYDSFGAKWLVRGGLIVAMIGLVMLMLAKPSSAIAYVILAHIILMIGIPTAMNPAQSSALGSLPEQLSTDGSTIVNTMQQVLGAIITAVTTVLLGAGQSSYMAANGSGAAKASKAVEQLSYVNGSRWGFGFALALAIIGFIVSFGIKEKKGVEAKEA